MALDSCSVLGQYEYDVSLQSLDIMFRYFLVPFLMAQHIYNAERVLVSTLGLMSLSQNRSTKIGRTYSS
ncbi:hypothetical protein MPER_07047 [Moniliophthora perniciosa FA553]|nr:hypothetical protein MPER_07047 [Moniliophthora perniciosa FA553]